MALKKFSFFNLKNPTPHMLWKKTLKKREKKYFFHFLEKRPLDIFGHFLGKCALFSEISRVFEKKRYYLVVAKNIFKK
jgi:hypothetical protein